MEQGGLGVGVQAGGGLVEQQQVSMAVRDPEEGAGRRDPAPFAGRETLPVVAHGVIEAQFGSAGGVQGGPQVGVRGAGKAKANVVADGAGDHAGVLPDVREAAPPGVQRDVVQGPTVYKNAALTRPDEPE